MFRRPFQDKTREGVYTKIKSNNPDPIPEDYNKDLKLILSLLLQKDPSKRPKSIELAKMPCILEAINSFSEEYDCREFVQLLLADNDDNKKEKKEEEDFQLQKKDLAEILIDLKDITPIRTMRNYPWSK